MSPASRASSTVSLPRNNHQENCKDDDNDVIIGLSQTRSPVGYRFNEFEIKEVIGGGGFGIVYRAPGSPARIDNYRYQEFMLFLPRRARGEDMTLVLQRALPAVAAGLNSFIREVQPVGALLTT